MIIDANTNKLYKLFLIFFVFIILGSVTGCGTFVGDAKEVAINKDDRYYTFDSTTIFDALNQESQNIFSLSSITPTPESSPPSVTIPWTQSDYLRVAEAVQQSILQEPLGALNLYYATFTMNCGDINKGTFSEVDFVFYKVIQTEEGATRVQYHIILIPSENFMKTNKAEFIPNIKIIEPIDLSRYQITAEKALQIAEENGGTQKRSEVNDSCMVFGMVDGPTGWTVTYQTRSEYRWMPIYKITIDPQTGSSKVVLSK